MSDLKPRRTARESGHSDVSPGEAAPSVNTSATPPVVPEAIVQQAATVAQAISAPAEALAKLTPAAVAPEVEKLADSAVDSAKDSWSAVAAAQAAFARGFEEIAAEMTGMTQAGIRAATDAAIALVGARTFSEAVEINARLARRGVDAMIEGSAKLSEIGVKAVEEASRPMVSQIGGTWKAIRQNATVR
jgi:hypothetical protein